MTFLLAVYLAKKCLSWCLLNKERKCASLSEFSKTEFSIVNSTKVGISRQNLLTFSFKPFVTLVQNFKAIPSISPKLLILNEEHLSKKLVFLVKFLQNLVFLD